MARSADAAAFRAFTDALFEEDGQVLAALLHELHQCARPPGPASSHDEWHYNREAGGLILDSLIERLDAAFAAG